MDAVLINMVQHNVGLREVDLRGVHVSDQWLHHLSQAPVIRYVSLTHCLASSITTDGVIHLLRGRSRNNLRLVRLVTSDSLSAQTIRQEIDLMHQENDSSVEVVLTPATNKLQQMGITTRVSVFL